MLPPEITILISKFSDGLNGYRVICETFGFRVSRRLVYRHFWRHIPVAHVYTIVYSDFISFDPDYPLHNVIIIFKWFTYVPTTVICLYHRKTSCEPIVDRPHLIYNDGTKAWGYWSGYGYIPGQYHRLNGPAIIGGNDVYEWWAYGQLTSTKYPYD